MLHDEINETVDFLVEQVQLDPNVITDQDAYGICAIVATRLMVEAIGPQMNPAVYAKIVSEIWVRLSELHNELCEPYQQIKPDDENMLSRALRQAKLDKG